MRGAVICIPELPASFTKLVNRLIWKTFPLLVQALRRCCFLLESGVESLSSAKLGLTLMPAGKESASQLTECPGRVKTQTHKAAHHVIENGKTAVVCLLRVQMFHY